MPYINYDIIGSDKGLLPVQCKAIIYSNAGILLIDQFHKSQNAHFCSEWSMVGYGTGAFWNLWFKSIGILQTNLTDIWIQIQSFLFNKMHLKISSAKWKLFCHSLNILKYYAWHDIIVQHVQFIWGVWCFKVLFLPSHQSSSFSDEFRDLLQPVFENPTGCPLKHSDKMADILQTAFSKFIFLNKDCYILIWVSLIFVFKCPVDMKGAFVQIIAWHWTCWTGLVYWCIYRKLSNISRTKPLNLDVSRLGLQLFLRNILKPIVGWRMKM